MPGHESFQNESEAGLTGATAFIDLSNQLRAAYPENSAFRYGTLTVPETDGYFATVNQGIGIAVFPRPDGAMEFIIVTPLPAGRMQEIKSKFGE